jgi:CheY-like chemotaxis protein
VYCGIFVAMAIQYILLVDDDADDQYVFKDALQNVNPSLLLIPLLTELMPFKNSSKIKPVP